MASASSANVDEIEDLLTCSMCLETLNEPRSLPCFHNFCKVCLGKYVERLRGTGKNIETFPCPTCRSEFTLKSNQDVAEIASSYFIKNMLEIMAIQRKAKASTKCFNCQNSAINHCATCEVFMCKNCSESHDIWPPNKSHNVLSVEELNNTECQVKIRSKFYCMKHASEILKYYCETCKELCCIDCVVLVHTKPNHSCLAVSEVSQKQRETLQSSCATLDEKLSEGKEALNTICEVMKSLEKNAKTAKDQIKEQKENILKIVVQKLDERAEKMNVEVNKAYRELHSSLSKQHDEIKDYLDKVQGSVSLPRNLLKRGSIEEMLSLQKVIDENIEKLANEQPENLAPVNNGNIQYVSEAIGDINVDEIVEKLGNIGNGSLPENLRNSSSILKGETAFMRQLHKWLGEKCKWNLCYRASRDGWSAKDFHRYCDNKGPTVVLVKANECIFGGYTDQNWHSAGKGGDYKQSNSSFLFSLRNKDNLAPFLANIKQGLEQRAIFCYSGFGPVFGGGDDLYIDNNPQINQSSYNNFGYTYQLPPGYVYGSKQANNLLAGQRHFLTTEIEVFS